MMVRGAFFFCALVLMACILSGCSQNDGASGFTKAGTRGQYVFDLHCANCHEELHPELRKQPPKLDGLFRKGVLPSGAPATDQQVRKTIVQGKGTMPAFDQLLREQDVDDLLKYLHTL